MVGTTRSTNADVGTRADAGEPAGLVLIAEEQTAGRGRLDRVWEAPACAGLTFSALVRPRAQPERWPWLPLLTGLAVVRALDDLGVAGGRVKWPNDVLLPDQRVPEGYGKAGGILLERRSQGGPAAVIGVGINVSTVASELPVPGATSLLLAGHDLGREDLLVAVLGRLAAEYARWESGDQNASLRADYATECATLGRQVQVSMPDGSSLTGEATGVDEAGRLVVARDGDRVTVGAGDVVHVRGQDGVR